MGKIRIKSFGDEELEKNQKNEDKKRQESKKTVKAPGLKGGERVVSIGPSEEELEAIDISKIEETKKEVKPTLKKEINNQPKKAYHSKAYQNLNQLVEKTKLYTLSEGFDLLEKLQRKTTDETVELHINTIATGISGNVTLPHGTGKKTKVAIATDDLIESIEKGKIDFDVLVAEPAMMVKLAKVAKILGPKGLMPNPKNGTITQNPAEVAKKYEGGQVNFKTEKAPIIHLVAGKMSFGKTKLTENIEELIKAVKKPNIVNITLKSTMSPGIKIKI